MAFALSFFPSLNMYIVPLSKGRVKNPGWKADSSQGGKGHMATGPWNLAGCYHIGLFRFGI